MVSREDTKRPWFKMQIDPPSAEVKAPKSIHVFDSRSIRLAFHETGHLLIGVIAGGIVDFARIAPERNFGETLWSAVCPRIDELAMVLAGPLSETLVLSTAVNAATAYVARHLRTRPGWAGDAQRASELARGHAEQDVSQMTAQALSDLRSLRFDVAYALATNHVVDGRTAEVWVKKFFRKTPDDQINSAWLRTRRRYFQ